jgi:hypothetical protein
MKKINAFLISTMLLSLVSTASCSDDMRNQLITQAPWSAPLIGRRPVGPAWKQDKGDLQGFVYGANGKSQPISLATVSAGGVSSRTGNPVNPVAAADEFTGDNANRTDLSVLHDYNDGKGPVPAQRFERKVPIGPEQRDRFYYLRKGEYLLESLPEGFANVEANYNNIRSKATKFPVYANKTSEENNLNIFIPQPVAPIDGRLPNYVQWIRSEPESGITVEVTPGKATETGAVEQPKITYKPDPPDVAVTLKAPPGSGGATIRYIDVQYSWNTLASPDKMELPPIRISIPPVIVPPAQDFTFGPPAIIRVPVGSASLRAIFNTTDAQQQPGLITAKIIFADAGSNIIDSGKDENLVVTCVLRSL